MIYKKDLKKDIEVLIKQNGKRSTENNQLEKKFNLLLNYLELEIITEKSIEEVQSFDFFGRLYKTGEYRIVDTDKVVKKSNTKTVTSKNIGKVIKQIKKKLK